MQLSLELPISQEDFEEVDLSLAEGSQEVGYSSHARWRQGGPGGEQKKEKNAPEVCMICLGQRCSEAGLPPQQCLNSEMGSGFSSAQKQSPPSWQSFPCARPWALGCHLSSSQYPKETGVPMDRARAWAPTQ
jgi:hypothetical protein